MREITQEDLKETITAFANSFDKQLFDCTQEELERYWNFKWNPEATLAQNLYEFHDMLDLYGSFCRRWEDHHNGYICIVGRVRDKYLMPKIKEFTKNFEHAVKSVV